MKTKPKIWKPDCPLCKKPIKGPMFAVQLDRPTHICNDCYLKEE